MEGKKDTLSPDASAWFILIPDDGKAEASVHFVQNGRETQPKIQPSSALS